MSLILYDVGAILINVKYLQPKKNRWYFRRRIPHDVRKLYPGKTGDIYFSLKTADKIQAAKQADIHARQQDALWEAYRSGKIDAGPEAHKAALGMLEAHGLRPGQWEEYHKAEIEPDEFLNELAHLSEGEDGQIVREDLPTHAVLAADLFYGVVQDVPFLSEALKLYQKLVGEEEGTKEHGSRVRAVQRLMDESGDMPIDRYTRENARVYVDVLLAEGKKTATVRRYVNYVSPVFNMAIREYELSKANVFEAIRIPKLGEDAEERVPFTPSELYAVQTACLAKDDDIRWLVALLSDTGMRLGEATGLQRQDVVLDHDVPHVCIRPNSARGLKTKSSERRVPLVGASLWAADRALSADSGEFLFPRYAGPGMNKATYASNTLVKWLAGQGIDKPPHSLRHSLRDRLRNVGAPEEVQDRIGGWSRKGVGQSYGQGHDLSVLREWMSKIVDQRVV